MCENRAKAAVALWYFIGYELMIERIASDRLNRWTTIDLKKAKDLRDFFFERARFELDNAARSIAIAADAPPRELIVSVTPVI